MHEYYNAGITMGRTDFQGDYIILQAMSSNPDLYFIKVCITFYHQMFTFYIHHNMHNSTNRLVDDNLRNEAYV